MNCHLIENFLQKNPGAALSDGLKQHAENCSTCKKLLQEQSALSGILKAMPQSDLPPHFGFRFASRMAEKQLSQKKWRWEPNWLTVAMPAMALIVAFSVILMRYELFPDKLKTPINTPSASVPANMPLAGTNSSPDAPQNTNTQIYPVWPGNEDVVDQENLTIMASLYPDNYGTGRVKILLDDQDVSSESIIDKQHIAYMPQRLDAGQHMVTVILQQPDGKHKSVSWSFYLLEGRS